MQNITIRKATKADTDVLIKLRIDYMTEYGGNLTDDEQRKTAELLREYYLKHIGGDFIAAIAEVDGKIVVATAFLVIYERPINPRAFITGKTALILNVLTYPEYRRQGIATKLLELLIDEAKKADASYIELSATEMGKPVYEKLGFTEHSHGSYTEMRLSL